MQDGKASWQKAKGAFQNGKHFHIVSKNKIGTAKERERTPMYR